MNVLVTVSAKIWTLNQFVLPFSPPYCTDPGQTDPDVRAETVPPQTGTCTNNHRWYRRFPHPNLHIRKINGLGMSKVLAALMFVMV